MKNTIQEIYIKLATKKILKNTTKGIGTYKILDDKIICHVNNKSFKRYCRKHKDKNRWGWVPIFISINGINMSENNSKLLYPNKKIEYVFENVDFCHFNGINITNIFGEATAIFRNCEFLNKIEIMGNSDVTFEDNVYLAFSNGYYGYWFNIYCDEKAHRIRFINDDVINTRHKEAKGMTLDLNCDEVEIFDSNITTSSNININSKKIVIRDSSIIAKKLELTPDNIEINHSRIITHSSININTKNLLLENSDIRTKTLELDADTISCDEKEYDYSVISAEGAIINNKDNNYKISYITVADTKIYNGVEVSTRHEDATVDKDKLELQDKRMKLLYELRNILNSSEHNVKQKIESITTNITTNINNTPIKKLLKK